MCVQEFLLCKFLSTVIHTLVAFAMNFGHVLLELRLLLEVNCLIKYFDFAKMNRILGHALQRRWAEAWMIIWLIFKFCCCFTIIKYIAFEFQRGLLVSQVIFFNFYLCKLRVYIRESLLYFTKALSHVIIIKALTSLFKLLHEAYIAEESLLVLPLNMLPLLISVGELEDAALTQFIGTLEVSLVCVHWAHMPGQVLLSFVGLPALLALKWSLSNCYAHFMMLEYLPLLHGH